MIVVHAALRIDPDRREQALDAVEKLVERTREEAGVIDYVGTTEVANPNVVRFVEQYEDEAALEAHNESAHYREFEAQLPQLLDSDRDLLDAIDVTQFAVDEAVDPNADVEADVDRQ
ncbi:Quinol monooxygenase YgiN [Halomicrobium zhouii]|uniref:Quinol monooxygenase YgiN n=1 Tax=Halomicrobium zhouii TaxID=767519 RepID=A0A1I6L8V6_9EURY|nr:putative quinol monooxygenase [Halomicrobium zhouii]SFR99921.1 Quinol monooxygenase YgiN [Halomicrobium zhouii]